MTTITRRALLQGTAAVAVASVVPAPVGQAFVDPARPGGDYTAITYCFQNRIWFIESSKVSIPWLSEEAMEEAGFNFEPGIPGSHEMSA